MSSRYIHPPSDPDIASIVERLQGDLTMLPETFDNFREVLEQGITPGQLRGITEEEYASLYMLAHQLCDQGDFHNALAIGLQLAFNEPRNANYAFLAGTCLQRTGQLQQAVLMYAMAFDLDDDHAAAAYRAGECLRSLDKPTEAKLMLEKSLDLSRGDFSRRELMLMAEKALAAL